MSRGTPGWNRRREGVSVPANVRARVVREANGLCEKCGQPGNEVDHRIPVSQGGTHDRDNLWLLCSACHAPKSRAEQQAGYQAWRAKGKRPAEAHPSEGLRPQ